MHADGPPVSAGCREGSVEQISGSIGAPPLGSKLVAMCRQF